MSGVNNEFMQDTLISLGAVLGISCIVRVCCVRFYHRRRMQQQSQGQGQKDKSKDNDKDIRARTRT